MRSVALLAAALLASSAAALQPFANEDTARGWVKLFDKESTFGWEVDQGAKLAVEGGALMLTAGKTAATATFLAPFPSIAFQASGVDPADGFLTFTAGSRQLVTAEDSDSTTAAGTNTMYIARGDVSVKGGLLTTELGPDRRFPVLAGSAPRTWQHIASPGAAGPIRVGLYALPGKTVRLSRLIVRPLVTQPIFSGHDLAGWTPYKGDPKREQSKFTVTNNNELRIQSGPGDLRTDKSYDDFLLQLQCKTNGTGLNSGVFVRCMPGQYQNGYEVQIQNAFKDGDRTKPVDFGTGAIYRRVPARKVVSNDNEYFTLTVLAAGPRIATWVDGYPTANWLDDRPADDNPRKGKRTAAGHISLQGHDPTTDLLFKDIRITPLK